MLLNTETRLTIKYGLELQIKIKENEIENIKRKPDTEYESRLKLSKAFSTKPESVEKLKEKDIQEKHNEIKELKKLQVLFNDLSNNILVVPKEIRLCLSDSVL